jgi:pyruvate dehydrogenase E1 component alpha subunit
MPEPPPEALFDTVYAEPHALLAEERQALIDFEAAFDDGRTT